jgi:hypothetical protein
MKATQIFPLAALAVLLHCLTPSAQAQSSFAAGTDSFAAAPAITTAHYYSATTSLLNYTSELAEPFHKPGGTAGARKTAWWKFTPTEDGYCTVDTVLSNTVTNAVRDTLLSVYTGSSVGDLTRVASSDDDNPNQTSVDQYYSLTSFYAKKGTTYQIAVDAFSTVNANEQNVILQLRHLPLKKATYIAILGGSEANFGTITYTTTAQGSLSGKLSLQNKSYPISGYFDLMGKYTGVIYAKTSTGTPNPLQIQIDGTQKREARVRQLSTPETPTNNMLVGAFFEKKVYPAQTSSPVAGVYNTHMFSVNDAAGYLIINIKANGTITATGSAQDGTPLSLSSYICEPYGQSLYPFVLFKSLLGGKATFLGNADVIEQGGIKYVTTHGLAGYIRQPNVGTFYPAGILNEVSMKGSPYTKPAPNTRALGFLNPNGAAFAEVVAYGVELPANVSVLGTLSTQNKFTFDVNPQKLTLKLNPANGLVTGSISLPNGKKSKIKALLANNGATITIQGLATGTTRNYPFYVEPAN